VYRFGLTLFLLATWGSLFAQTDSLAQKKGVASQLREVLAKTKLTKPDTIKIPGTSKVDSLENKLHHTADSLKQTNLVDKLSNRIDSINQLVHKPANKLNEKLGYVNTKIEDVEDSIQRKIDKLSNKVSSVQDEAQAKADSIQDKILSSVSSLQEKTESKIQEITGEKINIPGADKLEIPKGDIPSASIPGVDVALPNVDLPSELNVDLTTDKLNVDVTSIKEKLPDADILDPSKLDKVNELSDHVQKLDGKLAEAEKYEADIQNLKEGAPEKLEKLPEVAEQKLGEISEVKALSGEAAKLTAEQAKYEAMLKQYQDKKLLEAEIKRKAQAVANEYMAQHASKVQGAQQQLAKSKQGLGAVKKVKDIFTNRSDELVGKKFYQRLVPGLTWQTYRKDVVSTDFALQIGYRLTPRLNAGVGGIYRVGFSKDFDYYVRGLQTYGGRTYLDFAFGKGLVAHAEFEALNINPLIYWNSILTTEEIPENTYGSYFGLGKRFNITRNLRGNVLALYRIDYTEALPSVNKVSARFGMEYVFKKKKKKFSVPTK